MSERRSLLALAAFLAVTVALLTWAVLGAGPRTYSAKATQAFCDQALGVVNGGMRSGPELRRQWRETSRANPFADPRLLAAVRLIERSIPNARTIDPTKYNRALLHIAKVCRQGGRLEPTN
jgi:hypothetical protein